MQLIGTSQIFTDIVKTGEYEKFSRMNVDGEKCSVVGVIRTFNVFVDDNPLHPAEAIYYVKVVHVKGIGTETLYYHCDMFGDYTGDTGDCVDLNPVDYDDAGTLYMEFSLYKSMQPLDEHATNVASSKLQPIEEMYGQKKFVGQKSKASYVLQFNKYLGDIWMKKVSPPTEQKECPHVGKRQKRK